MKNRSGSYKKILIAEGLLEPNRLTLIKNIDLMMNQDLEAFELCTLYILLFLRIRHPKNWLQKKTNFTPVLNQKKLLDIIPLEFGLTPWEKEKLKDLGITDLFAHYNLKGIPQAVNRTILNWAQGHWNIKLLTYIPSPRELLRMQVKNARCVTLTVKHNEIDQFVLSSRDPLSFVLHDLHHADQFFNQDESLKGQLGFYFLVDQIYDQPQLKKSLKEDLVFKSEFEYVVSDMNAYVIHLFKCFKSACTRTDAQSQASLFQQILNWWDMSKDLQEASNRLNTPAFQDSDELKIKTFFENKMALSI